MSNTLAQLAKTFARAGVSQYASAEFIEALADRIEELEAENHLLKTSGIAEVAARNPSVMEYMQHWEGRAESAEAKLAKAVEALDEVMIGGNQLAAILPDSFPPAETDPLMALETMGYGYDISVIWCCWRAIMLARTTLAELKGQDDE